MDRLRLKNDAKQDIHGKLWLALQPLVIMYLINYFVSFFSAAAERTENHDVYIALTVIYSVLSVVYAVLYFSLYVGVCRYYLSFTGQQYMSWTVIFDGLKNGKAFLQQFICYIMTGLIVLAGTICFIIPGIYFAIRYSMTGYIYAEEPELKWKDAMKRSYDLMNGHVWEYFCLVFSFFWWWCLVAITFGIAAIYVGPYMNCTTARYYKSLRAVRDGINYKNNSFGNGPNGFTGNGNDGFSTPFTIDGPTVRQDGQPFPEDGDPFSRPSDDNDVK